jgi:hypothetical protein
MQQVCHQSNRLLIRVNQFVAAEPHVADDALGAIAGKLVLALGGEPYHIMLRRRFAVQVAHAVRHPVPDDLLPNLETSPLNRQFEGFLHVPAAEAQQRAAVFEDVKRGMQPPDERLPVVLDFRLPLRPISPPGGLIVDAVGRISCNQIDLFPEVRENVQAVAAEKANASVLVIRLHRHSSTPFRHPGLLLAATVAQSLTGPAGRSLFQKPQFRPGCGAQVNNALR